MSSSCMQPHPMTVSNSFVKQYYYLLTHDPALLHRFYKDTSCFSRCHGNQVEYAISGQRAINEKILSIGYRNAHVNLEDGSVDCQASHGEGVLVMVTGDLTLEKDVVPRRFVQTFFLAVQPNGFFVLNDMLRFLETDSERQSKKNKEPQSQEDEEKMPLISIGEEQNYTYPSECHLKSKKEKKEKKDKSKSPSHALQLKEAAIPTTGSSGVAHSSNTGTGSGTSTAGATAAAPETEKDAIKHKVKVKSPVGSPKKTPAGAETSNTMTSPKMKTGNKAVVKEKRGEEEEARPVEEPKEHKKQEKTKTLSMSPKRSEYHQQKHPNVHAQGHNQTHHSTSPIPSKKHQLKETEGITNKNEQEEATSPNVPSWQEPSSKQSWAAKLFAGSTITSMNRYESNTPPLSGPTSRKPVSSDAMDTSPSRGQSRERSRERSHGEGHTQNQGQGQTEGEGQVQGHPPAPTSVPITRGQSPASYGSRNKMAHLPAQGGPIVMPNSRGKHMDKAQITSSSLYIRNIPQETKDVDLRRIFEVFGHIMHVNVNVMRNYAFIDFAHVDSVKKALDCRQPFVLYKKQLHVEQKNTDGNKRSYRGGVQMSRGRENNRERERISQRGGVRGNKAAGGANAGANASGNVGTTGEEREPEREKEKEKEAKSHDKKNDRNGGKRGGKNENASGNGNRA